MEEIWIDEIDAIAVAFEKHQSILRWYGCEIVNELLILLKPVFQGLVLTSKSLLPRLACISGRVNAFNAMQLALPACWS